MCTSPFCSSSLRKRTKNTERQLSEKSRLSELQLGRKELIRFPLVRNRQEQTNREASSTCLSEPTRHHTQRKRPWRISLSIPPRTSERFSREFADNFGAEAQCFRGRFCLSSASGNELTCELNLGCTLHLLRIREVHSLILGIDGWCQRDFGGHCNTLRQMLEQVTLFASFTIFFQLRNG